jgi:acyl carrier protein
MQSLITPEKVLEEVRKATVETLRIKEDQIQLANSFVKDLGLESLDFLDINYRLEQAFGIKMARHFFLEHVEEMFGEGTAIDPRGKLTEKALKLLTIRYDPNNLPDLSKGLDMDEVPALITVQSMVDVVMDILETLPEKCPSCGASAWKTEDGTHIICGQCGADGVFTNGDELIKEWLNKVQADTKLFTA